MSEPTCTAHLENPATTRASYLCPCGHREDQSWCSFCTALAAPMQLGDTDVYTARDMTCPGCGEDVALVAVTPLVYTDQFGPKTPEVARFVTALETMPRDLLERAEAWLMPGCCESPEWATVAARAEELGLHDVEFVGAIEAAWAHAARHPQFEHWDHVWDAGASHTAASLVVRGQIPPETFNALAAPFIAAGAILAEPPAQLDTAGRLAAFTRALEANRATWQSPTLGDITFREFIDQQLAEWRDDGEEFDAADYEARVIREMNRYGHRLDDFMSNYLYQSFSKHI